VVGLAPWWAADPSAGVAALLRPYPPDRLAAGRVGPAVNRVANDGPECLTPTAYYRPSADPTR
jgi:putative SOS response-associated peptidase YedK